MSKQAKAVIKLLATGFYSGLSPVCPGTIGSLAALIVAYFWLQYFTVGFLLVLILTGVGTIISQWAEKIYGEHDSPKIVIDEWAGYFISLFGLGSTMLIPAFILFRIFDILKPPPIKQLQDLPGGVGIMIDDVLAGIMANLLLRLVIYFI
ncbi:phosphatidylglycerophosphatase A family protein [Fuchsiella alkaliacetigena]|uniref:phosphatidylglycerophosphatase A family protein n=1 Tax=Fuchsiella alkaliacetigena TaxID=957042 RepID=UPI00200B13D3|nr:phosphatidylglycerophosphatase A [Fuchsiella alkaliacetigena]MCK8824941.1 phosphatidylglycerophosphatase A [Fuchsiella alkaliacetigena]